MTDRGLYHGLDRGPGALARHNRAVPGDRQSDACPCPQCTSDVAAPAACASGGRGDHRPLPSPAFSVDAQRAAPVALGPVQPAPVARGPVQDESGVLDAIDAAAMRAVEGRADDGEGA